MMKVITLFLLLLFPIYSTPRVVVVGGGVAGMSAALQLSQAGLEPLVIVGEMPGGIITTSPGVENWPGEISITGASLADKLEQQLENRGIKMMTGAVTSVDFSSKPFKLYINNNSAPIIADSCIIAMGATPNFLKIPGEEPLLYKKIFTCAPCDGLRFKDQIVAVIGGGESALIEAHYLSNIAKQVIILVRGKEFKTIQPALKAQLLSKPNVKVQFQTVVKEFQDDPNGIKLKLPHETLLVQGVFLAIGSRPNTDLLKKSLKLDASGYIVLKEGQATSVPGVFAAGDVCDRTYKQAITAAGDATKAALDAIHYLATIPAAPTEISDLTTLRSTIQSSSKPTVAYFYSPSCLPCRSFKPLFQQWSQDYNSTANFIKINGEVCPACFEAYKVNAMPTVLVIDTQGKVTHRAVGAVNMSEIVKFLEQR